MTSQTFDTWTADLREIFNAAATPRELLIAASTLWDYRHCGDGGERRVWDYALPAYRSRMEELWPGHKQVTVVALDLPAILYAAWYVSGTSAEHPIKMLRNVYRATAPGVFICAVDKGEGKRALDPLYKDGRDIMPPEFYDMCHKVRDSLEKSGVQIEEHDGTESDDIMASIAFRCQLLDQPCILCTEDKDLWQSLGKGTAIYSPKTKAYRNAEWLMSEHRIKPAQFVDWISLKGGKNSLPGCERVGAKTASDWLEAHGDVLGIEKEKASLTAKQQENFNVFYRDIYFRVKELHTLKRNVNVGWSNNTLERQKVAA